jgi:hypothetical protein
MGSVRVERMLLAYRMPNRFLTVGYLFQLPQLEVADGALEDGHLRNGVAGFFELVADLFLEVGRVSELLDQHFQEAVGGEKSLGLEFLDGLITYRNVAGPDVQDDVVITSRAQPLEAEPLHNPS